MSKVVKFFKVLLSILYLAALYVIPYADIDVAGLLAGSVFGNLGKIPILGLPFKALSKLLTIFPYVNEIYITKLSKMQAIIFAGLVLIPYVDLEGIRLLEKIGLKQMKIFQFAKGGKAAKAAKTAAHHSDEIAHEGRKELLRHGGSEHEDEENQRGQQGGRRNPQGRGGQRGRAMTDGGQPPPEDSGEDSSIGGSLSNSMPSFGGSSDTFTLEFRQSMVGESADVEKHDEIEVEYDDDEGTLEAVDGELAVGSWWNDEEQTSISIEKRDGDFVPSPYDRQTVKRLAGVADDSDPAAGSDGGSGGGSGRLMTDGGSSGGGGSGGGPGIDEGTIKAVGAGALVLGLIGFLWFSGWGQQLSDSAGLASTGIDMDSQMRQIQGMLKQVQCFGSAACYRQWQMNNTERPGSEEVGERYALQIENFDVNDGYTLDVNRRKAETTVPVGFSVYNPRNGLKGITAEDVYYRISILGPDSDQADPICQTEGDTEGGWIELGGQFADGNAIMPGGFATPSEELSELNLGNCGLLQPALGINRKVELQIKYDYASQATLSVEAMSWENLQSLGERPEFKKSETADTPVQSYINAESPIVYRENEDGGGRTSDQFQVKLGFETDENNLKYRIDPESIKFYDSTETTEVAGSRCELNTDNSANNEYSVSDVTKEYFDRRVEADDTSTWFDSVTGPSPIRCTMELEEPRRISPTGETLNMRIEGDYTVMFEEEFTEFEVKNTACEDLGTYNCPLLVTKHAKQQTDYSGVYSECSSDRTVDASNGCDIRMFDGKWEVINGPINAKSVDGDIEEGEVALTWQTFIDEWAQQREFDVMSALGLQSGDGQVITTTYDATDDAENIENAEDPITDPPYEGSNCGEDGSECPEESRFGLPTDEKDDFLNPDEDYPYVSVVRDDEEGNADVIIENIPADTVICQDSLGDMSKEAAVYKYLSDHADSRNSDFQHLLWGQMTTGDCTSGLLESLWDDINPFNEGYEDKRKNCNEFMYVRNGNGDCFVS